MVASEVPQGVNITMAPSHCSGRASFYEDGLGKRPPFTRNFGVVLCFLTIAAVAMLLVSILLDL